jgi:hypothetical protein
VTNIRKPEHHAPPLVRIGRRFQSIADNDAIARKEKLPSGGYDYQRIFDCQKYNNTYAAQLAELAPHLYTSRFELGNMPAGYTYFGQFVAHELSFMRATGDQYYNAVSANLDLSTVFNDNGLTSPNDVANPNNASAPCQVGNAWHNGAWWLAPCDLPRDENGSPFIADPRADDLLPLAQFNVLFLNLFNNIHAAHLNACGNELQAHKSARRECILLFQEAVWHDYLPRVINHAIWQDVYSNGPVFISCDEKEGTFKLPLEFAAAMFRFGHAQTRKTYTSWSPGQPAELATFFANTHNSSNNPIVRLDLLWATRWQRLFDFRHVSGIDATAPLFANRIRPEINSSMQEIPATALHGSNNHIRSVAARTLLRVIDLELSDAQHAIDKLNKVLISHNREPIAVLSEELKHPNLKDYLEGEGSIFLDSTPLWLYILCEAWATQNRGETLGSFGSRIVAETVFHAIACCPDNIFTAKGWQPGIKLHAGPHTTLPDIILAAGAMDPTRPN